MGLCSWKPLLVHCPRPTGLGLWHKAQTHWGHSASETGRRGPARPLSSSSSKAVCRQTGTLSTASPASACPPSGWSRPCPGRLLAGRTAVQPDGPPQGCGWRLTAFLLEKYGVKTVWAHYAACWVGQAVVCPRGRPGGRHSSLRPVAPFQGCLSVWSICQTRGQDVSQLWALAGSWAAGTAWATKGWTDGSLQAAGQHRPSLQPGLPH